MGSRKFWVYVNLFRGCLIDCEHFRSVVLNVWTRKDLMNTQKFTFLSKSVSCPYKARVLKNHISHVFFHYFQDLGPSPCMGMMHISQEICLVVCSLTLFGFITSKPRSQKCSQSIRLPRNMFIYTQKCLEPISRRRFFLLNPKWRL